MSNPEKVLADLVDESDIKDAAWERAATALENKDTAEAATTIVNILKENFYFKTPRDTQRLWQFSNPVYHDDGEQTVKELLYENLPGQVKRHIVNEVIEQLKSRTYCKRRNEKAPLKYIPVENGWYNLKTDQLETPQPEYFAVNHIPIEYDEDADCPEIKEFIKEVVHDDDVKLVQEMIGYTLYRGYPLARAFMLLGSGGNGKSTLLELIKEFIGRDNIANPSLQKLGEDRFAAAQLYGNLANIHADLSSKAVENTGTFKMLTGGDLIHAERKFEDPFQFENYATLIFSANELPQTHDTTEAFFRRWVVIDFPYKFTSNPDDGNKDKDPDLPESILTDEELSGLFNWVVEGLQRVLQQEGFSETEGRKSIKYRWLMQTQPIQVYFEEGLQEEQDVSVGKDELYAHYEDFCMTLGVQAKGKRQFFKQLYGAFPSAHEKKVRSATGRERRIQGVGLNNLEGVVQLVQSETSLSRAGAARVKGDSQSRPTRPPLDELISDLDRHYDTAGVPITELEAKSGYGEEELERRIAELEHEGVVYNPKPGQVKKL
ncbi:MAG: phage/plasmid primase, P4 family [Halobacteriaceae archaeon]